MAKRTEYQRNYYQQNKERISAQRKQHREEIKQKLAELEQLKAKNN